MGNWNDHLIRNIIIAIISFFVVFISLTLADVINAILTGILIAFPIALLVTMVLPDEQIQAYTFGLSLSRIVYSVVVVLLFTLVTYANWNKYEATIFSFILWLILIWLLYWIFTNDPPEFLKEVEDESI